MTSQRWTPGLLSAAALAAILLLAPAGASAQGYQPNESLSGPHNPSMDKVDALLARAKTQFAHQDYDKAIALDEQALAVSEKDLGQGPYTAVVLTDLGLAYASAGRYDDAEKAYLHALTIRDKSKDKDSVENLTLLNNIGLLYSNTDRAAQALPYLQRAWDICTKHLRSGDVRSKATREHLADAYRRLGRNADADALMQAK
jgi:tetratricopeptide (TPR) repeat protein